MQHVNRTALRSKKQKNINWIEDRIKYFWERKRVFESTKLAFEEDKEEFYSDMDKWFDTLSGGEDKVKVSLNAMVKGVGSLVCNRIVTPLITYKEDLKLCMSKEQIKKVYKNKYEVKNWIGLLQLIRDAGIKRKDFLKYVDCKEYVDENALANLIEVGDINEADVRDCIVVRGTKRYYKVSETK